MRFNSINKLKSFLKRRNMDREELASWVRREAKGWQGLEGT